MLQNLQEMIQDFFVKIFLQERNKNSQKFDLHSDLRELEK